MWKIDALADHHNTQNKIMRTSMQTNATNLLLFVVFWVSLGAFVQIRFGIAARGYLGVCTRVDWASLASLCVISRATTWF